MLRAILSKGSCAAIAIACLLFTPLVAYGQPQCDARDSVISVLSNKYKEFPEALGVTANGGLIEVFATEDGATWSIIVTTPQGMSCLVAAGEGWRSAPEHIAEDPAL